MYLDCKQWFCFDTLINNYTVLSCISSLRNLLSFCFQQLYLLSLLLHIFEMADDDFTNCLLKDNKLLKECLQLLHTATSLPNQNIFVNFSPDLFLCYIIISSLSLLCIFLLTVILHVIVRRLPQPKRQPSVEDLEASNDFATRWRPVHSPPRERPLARPPSSVAASATGLPPPPSFSTFMPPPAQPKASEGKFSFNTSCYRQLT